MQNLVQIGLWGLLGRYTIFITIILLIYLFFAQPSGQTPEWLLMHNIPKYVESCKVQTFGGKNN